VNLRESVRRKIGPALWLSTLAAGMGIGACVVTTAGGGGTRGTAGSNARAVDPGMAAGLLATAAQAAPPYDPSAEPVVAAVRKAAPAVVSIDTTARQDILSGDPFFGYERVGTRQVPTGAGSGVILGDGYVLTNQHVVGDALENEGTIKVTLADGRSFDARAVGADYRTDIALLKVSTSEKLPAIPVGAQDTLMPGQSVIAIGNPVGLSASVSAGVVSALGRPLTTDGRTYENLIQTDTAINPGNSGGALIDLGGNLVGINTLVRADAQNIGFAIPIKTALRIADTLKRFGKVSRPDLGLVVTDINPRLARYLRLARGTQGVVVVNLFRGSAAVGAGIRPGDVVTAVGDIPVADEAGYQKAVEALKVGGRTTVTVLRGGQQAAVPLPVGEAPR
jgi:S1-C subfamily serine protease